MTYQLIEHTEVYTNKFVYEFKVICQDLPSLGSYVDVPAYKKHGKNIKKII